MWCKFFVKKKRRNILAKNSIFSQVYSTDNLPLITLTKEEFLKLSFKVEILVQLWRLKSGFDQDIRPCRITIFLNSPPPLFFSRKILAMYVPVYHWTTIWTRSTMQHLLLKTDLKQNPVKRLILITLINIYYICSRCVTL